MSIDKINMRDNNPRNIGDNLKSQKELNQYFDSPEFQKDLEGYIEEKTHLPDRVQGRKIAKAPGSDEAWNRSTDDKKYTQQLFDS
jgi:hypothetical protein